tara:strand:- start:40 stop:426 length:387 start_codon:yes stop_codon:yes gene_type:complete
MTRARDLSKLANDLTLTIDTTNTRVGIGSTYPTVQLDVGTGQIKGDGSLLTGVTGLGTALATSGTLSNFYYVNKSIHITADTTVTVPATSTSDTTYTNFQDVIVDDDQDLIVADGDSFLVDVLALSEV